LRSHYEPQILFFSYRSGCKLRAGRQWGKGKSTTHGLRTRKCFKAVVERTRYETVRSRGEHGWGWKIHGITFSFLLASDISILLPTQASLNLHFLKIHFRNF
jgi:hypothetical protein